MHHKHKFSFGIALLPLNHCSSLWCHNPIVPMSTSGHGEITPPTLPPDQYPCTLSLTTSMGPVCNWQNWQICPLGLMRTWTTPNWLLLTPQNHLRATHILIAFLAAATETEQQDDDNRSIGWNYCIGTTADGPYVAAGIVACEHIIVLDASCS